MGVQKKGKRKLQCCGRTFYWYVNHDDEDGGKLKLHIISENKKFIVSYEVGQAEKPYMVVQGKEFAGLESYIKGSWIRVRTPVWEDKMITPKFIETMIKWCLESKQEITILNWEGKIVETHINPK